MEKIKEKPFRMDWDGMFLCQVLIFKILQCMYTHGYAYISVMYK